MLALHRLFSSSACLRYLQGRHGPPANLTALVNPTTAPLFVTARCRHSELLIPSAPSHPYSYSTSLSTPLFVSIQTTAFHIWSKRNSYLHRQRPFLLGNRHRDFTSTAGNATACVLGAADPGTNVDWLALEGAQDDLASKIFCRWTAACCVAGSVKYTAKRRTGGIAEEDVTVDVVILLIEFHGAAGGEFGVLCLTPWNRLSAAPVGHRQPTALRLPRKQSRTWMGGERGSTPPGSHVSQEENLLECQLEFALAKGGAGSIDGILRPRATLLITGGDIRKRWIFNEMPNKRPSAGARRKEGNICVRGGSNKVLELGPIHVTATTRAGSDEGRNRGRNESYRIAY
ncbi:hypothetical protein B0H19DRAFT_1071116 [Mycena capillaripes]|nr:hypothetical protein B0H19DRAFT_1071116 [Mycena capillaripes]